MADDKVAQFGVNVANQTTPFTAQSTLLGAFNGVTTQAGQQMGFFIGTGDQDNFIELVLTGDNGGSLMAIREVNGVDTVIATQSLVLPGPASVNRAAPLLIRRRELRQPGKRNGDPLNLA